jgi:hypothetical protein
MLLISTFLSGVCPGLCFFGSDSSVAVGLDRAATWAHLRLSLLHGILYPVKMQHLHMVWYMFFELFVFVFISVHVVYILLTVLQLHQKILNFHRNWGVHCSFHNVQSLSWARSIQSMFSHQISLSCVLILYFHRILDLPSGFFRFALQKPISFFPLSHT